MSPRRIGWTVLFGRSNSQNTRGVAAAGSNAEGSPEKASLAGASELQWKQEMFPLAIKRVQKFADADEEQGAAAHSD